MKIVYGRPAFLAEIKNLLPSNPTCLEIGVHLGDFSELMVRILNPKKCYLMDPFEHKTCGVTDLELYPIEYSSDGIPFRTVYSDNDCYETVVGKLYPEIKSGQVIIDRNLSTEALNNYDDESIDFIYIDAIHLYEPCLWDLTHYFKKLKVGGIIAGDDYTPFWSGVMKAVDEFCQTNSMEIIIHNVNSGDFALSKKKLGQ